MKICVVTHSLIKGDGQGRVNYEVVTEALRQGHEVTVLASNVDRDLEQNDRFHWVCISVKNLPTALIKEMAFSYQSAKWLRKHQKLLDVIMVNGAITDFAGDVNAIHFVHSSWLKSPVHSWQKQKNLYGLYQLFYTLINAYWEKQALTKAKVVVAICEKVKSDLIEIGVPEAKIQVINNGVDLKEFYPANVNRLDFNLPENVTLGSFVGDIRTSRKNLDTVLKALVKVSQLHIAVAGDTANSPYPQMAKDLGIEEKVHFLGYRSDMAQIFKATNLVVFPSRYEPFGLVILEAMATGLPVVTASTVGAAELVDSNCGVVIKDPDNVDDLAAKLNELVNNKDKMQQMGTTSRNVALKHSWLDMAHKYCQLFAKLSQSA